MNVSIIRKPAQKHYAIFTPVGGLNNAVGKEFTGIVPGKDGNVRIHFGRDAQG